MHCKDTILRTQNNWPYSKLIPNSGNHALCGAYFFSSGKGFLKVAHQLLDNSIPNKSEFYVSLLYNYLLKNGETVKLCLMENYYSYGTPEELKRYM